MGDSQGRKFRATQVRVLWPTKPDEPLRYANQMALTSTGQEYVLEFGQSFLVGLFGRDPSEIDEMVSTPKEIDVVARIVLSQSGVRALTKLLNEHGDGAKAETGRQTK